MRDPTTTCCIFQRCESAFLSTYDQTHMARKKMIGPKGIVGTKMEKAIKKAKEIQTDAERHD